MSEHPQPTLPFSFASGKHRRLRTFLEWADGILTRTVYRPFMRFRPPSVVRLAIPVSSLPPALVGFTMVQMSDLHHSQVVPLSVIEEAVAVTNRLAPDAIFLTGDFVSNDASWMADCARVLGTLRASCGVYAVLGNHDYWTDPGAVAAPLRANGIPVLINEARELTANLWVVGVDDVWSGQPDLDRALAGVPEGAVKILLAHEPDYADQAQGRGIALQLSGHSHGGNVHVPFTRRILLPLHAWKYYAGLRKVGDLWLYTNSGLGTMLPPLIFTCTPEITLITLVPA